MDYTGKIRCASNSFYNQGLERAKIRNLTGAVESLKKSLHFNKYQTDARNLLGLIYYEMGETAEALVQWVISTNLQPENNRAEYYLRQIQGRKGSLNADNQRIRKYNQGLAYARSGSDDLAVLQLNKVVEEKPNYVKAQLLLALLYIVHEEYGKAGKCAARVLQTDRGNPKAQWYLSIVKENKSRAESGKRKKNTRSQGQSIQEEDIIVPSSYKENTRDQAVVNIIAGVVLGAAVIFFLVMPAKTKSINVEHNQELQVYSEKINLANQEIDRLNAQLAQMEEDKKTAEDTVTTLTSGSGSILAQYKILAGILNAYKNGDFAAAVTLYVTLDPSLIADQDLLAIIAEVKADMDANGYLVLENLGDGALAGGDGAAALDYYLKSLSINGENWPLKYKVAMLYKEQNQQDQANDLFTDIIANSQNEELANQAKNQRGF